MEKYIMPTRLKNFKITVLVVTMLSNVTQTAFAADKQEDYSQDLLFKVTFDDAYKPHAVFSKGDSLCSLQADLGLRGQAGIKGNCLLLKDGEKCRYKALDNVNPHQGTVSFWIKPQNWDAETKRMIRLINIYQNMPAPFYISLTKAVNKNSITASISSGNKKRGDHNACYLTRSIKWDKKTWHKIDLSWDKNHLALYVDGRLKGETSIKGIVFPKKWQRNGIIDLTTISPQTHKIWSPKDRTFIDEIEIFNTVHSKAQILERYKKDVPSAQAPNKASIVPNIITAPLLKNKISIDGKVEEIEWQNATSMPLNINLKRNEPSKFKSIVYTCYDKKNLYIAFKSEKQKEKLITKQAWNADGFEILLSKGEKTSKNFYHWIINSDGIFYDAFAKNKKWKSNANAKSSSDGKYFQLEVAIPFKDLGINSVKKLQKFRANFCRTFNMKGKSPVLTAWTYTGVTYNNYQELYGTLILGDKNDALKMNLLPGLLVGSLAIKADAAFSGIAKLDIISNKKKIINKEIPFKKKLSIKESLDIVDGKLIISIQKGSRIISRYSTDFTVKKAVTLAYYPYIKKKKLVFKIHFNLPEWQQTLKKNNLKLDYTIKTPSGRTIKKEFLLKEAEQDLTLPLEFEDGNYMVSWQVSDLNNKKTMSGTDSFFKPKTPWINSTVGVSDEVIIPWTPMKLDHKNTVSCWSRDYTFNGPFISKLLNKGKDLLPAPMEFSLKNSSGKFVFNETSRECIKETSGKVEFKGKGIFAGSAVKAKWRSWMEYDGFTWAEITLIPPKEGIKIDKLSLNIPLKKEVVKYVRHAKSFPNPYSYIVLKDKAWESGFEPHLFVCNEDEGFSFTIEEERNWVYPKNTKVTIVDPVNEPGIKLNFIDQSMTLKKPVTYKIGFQAAPVKPLFKGWRKRNFGTFRDLKGMTDGGVYTRFNKRLGGWLLKDKNIINNIKKFIEKKRDLGINPMWYNTFSSTQNKNPIYNFFKNNWANPYSTQWGPMNDVKCRIFNKNPEDLEYNLMPVCSGAKTYADFFAWSADDFLKKIGPAGLYTDLFQHYKCENKYHGHGFTDQFGKTGPTYPWLKMRDAAKRVATIVKKHDPTAQRAYWMGHRHAMFVLPIHGFCDFFYPGEQFSSMLYKKPWGYMDVIDEKAWRIDCSSILTGVPHVNLPNLKRGTGSIEDIKKPQPTESLIAIMAVNDINTDASYTHGPTTAKWWEYKDKCPGLREDDVKFIAYWRPECPVKALMPKTIASVFIHPKGITIPIANKKPEATLVPIKLDAKALGITGKNVTITDVRTGGKLVMKDNTIYVPVKGRNYTYVTIR
jgi:glycosyl hydrolase family 123/cellulose/xylan binding protein with CBM9 domain/concanavalin A-like lectin/glucanase superfamily protein